MRRATLAAAAVLLIACGARKPKAVRAPASVPSVAPATTPAWVELPNPIAPDALVIPTDEPARTDGPNVFADATDLFTLEQNHRASMGSRGRTARALHAFWVLHPEGTQEHRRQVHCSTARVIIKQTGPLTRSLGRFLPQTGATAARSGRATPTPDAPAVSPADPPPPAKAASSEPPHDPWFVWVDPTQDAPSAPRVVGLSMYRHLVKYHVLTYRGRVGGLALYEYLKPRPVPEGS